MKLSWLTVGLVIVVLLSACSSGNATSIEIVDPWARAVRWMLGMEPRIC